MRLGVLSDVHGNRVALSATLADAPGVDGWLCAGDVVGYNPWPGECVERVRELPAPGDGGADGADSAPAGAPTVMGNHDRAVATDSAFRFNAMARAGVEYAVEELGEEHLDWLRALPDRRTECDGRVAMVHGHPDDVDRYTYPDEFDGAMLGDADLLVLGHTHTQGARAFDEGVVLNPGSVGQPRDGDPRAAYATVELDAAGVVDWDLRRVEYDVDAVQAAVAEAGLPAKIGRRLEQGR
jgi:putative phosphoesterase